MLVFLFVMFLNKANKKGKHIWAIYILREKILQMFVYAIHQVYYKPCLFMK